MRYELLRLTPGYQYGIFCEENLMDEYSPKSSSNMFFKMDISHIFYFSSKGYEFVGFQIITDDMIHTKVKHIQIMDVWNFFLQSHISLQEHTPFTK